MSANRLKGLGRAVFGTIALIEFVLKTGANSSASQYVPSAQRRFSQAIFPTVSLPSTLSSLPARSFPQKGSPKLFPTVSSPSIVSSLPHRSFSTVALPRLFPTVSTPSTLSSLPSRSFPPKLSPRYYFPRFPLHRVVASASLLLNGALPKLFPTVSTPSTPSQRSSPPSYFPWFFLRPPLVASVSLPRGKAN